MDFDKLSLDNDQQDDGDDFASFISQMVESREERHREHSGGTDDLPVPLDDLILSVVSAHDLATKIASSLGGARVLRGIVDYVCDPQNEVSGDADDYHNLAVVYAAEDAYDLALRVVDHGLERFPRNMDLISDGISWAADVGDFDRADAYYERAKRISPAFWNARCYDRVLGYFTNKIESVDEDALPVLKAEALEVADKYIAMFPTDERGYALKAMLHLRINEREEARRIVEQAIFGTPAMPGGLMATTCCMIMLDQILEESMDFDLVIRVATRGILCCATEQPSSTSLGYFTYREALARDAKLYLAGDSVDGFGSEPKVRMVLGLYQTAGSLLRDRKRNTNIRNRFEAISRRAGITDMEPPRGLADDD